MMRCARFCRSPAWGEERARAVEITGGTDPILPTPFRIGETGAATLAAVGLAVADLWALRTGRRQEVAVDTRQATASLRSGHYMRMDGAAVSTERNTVMGVYPAKHGRWSYLHCAAALGVLGVPEEREAVRQAVAQWDALEFEEAIIAAKAAGGTASLRVSRSFSCESAARPPGALCFRRLPRSLPSCATSRMPTRRSNAWPLTMSAPSACAPSRESKASTIGIGPTMRVKHDYES